MQKMELNIIWMLKASYLVLYFTGCMLLTKMKKKDVIKKSFDF